MGAGTSSRRISTADRVSDTTPIAVKAAPLTSVSYDSLNSYDKALFMATRHSFAAAMPTIVRQLELGVQGLELAVHHHDGTAALSVGANAPGEGANPENGAGGNSLEEWLRIVADWSRRVRGGSHPPITMWLSFEGDGGGGAEEELCEVNEKVMRAFGPALFTPLEMARRWQDTWPLVEELSGRVLVVLGGSREVRRRYRAEDCDSQPAASMNGRGHIVVVSEASGALFCWVGQLLPNVGHGEVSWHAYRRLAKGRCPAVAVNDSGLIVAVFEGADDHPDLRFRIGRVLTRAVASGEWTDGLCSDDLDVLCCGEDAGTPYDSGTSPSVALNNDGVVVTVHSNGDVPLLGWKVGLVEGQGSSEEPWRIRWMTAEEAVGAGSQLLVSLRGCNPTSSVRFESQSSSELLIVHECRVPPPATSAPIVLDDEAGEQDDTEVLQSPSRSRSQSVVAGSSRSGSRPQCKATGDYDLRRTLVRGVVGLKKTDATSPALVRLTFYGGASKGCPGDGGSSGGSPGPTSDTASAPPTSDTQSPRSLRRNTSAIFEHVLKKIGRSSSPGPKSSSTPPLPEDQPKTALPPTPPLCDLVSRSLAIVGDSGQTSLQVKVVAHSSAYGPRVLNCAVGRGSFRPVRLRQLCFVETHKGDQGLMQDAGVRFSGCSSRDEEFGMASLNLGRVLRMWKFNAISCKKSKINPHFPATDDPESDWYLSYLDSCGR